MFSFVLGSIGPCVLTVEQFDIGKIALVEFLWAIPSADEN
jgi:hypothetical protein